MPKPAKSAISRFIPKTPGKTWQLDRVVLPKANKCQVFELFDSRGTLLMNTDSGLA